MDTLAWSAIAVIVGLALAPLGAPALPGCVGLFAVGLAFARWRLACLPLTGLALGALIGSSLPEGPVLRGPVAVQGVVAAAPMGRVADLSVWACAEAAGGFAPCRGRVRVIFAEPPAPGSRWVVAGDADVPRSPRLAGEPDPSRSAALSRARTVLRARSAARLGGDLPVVPPDAGARAVLAAVARGDRRGVDAETWAILRDTGTSHLLAISGFHVGVVAGGIGGLVAFGLRRMAWIRPEGVSLAWAWWAGALAAVAYAGMAGAPISAQRAAGVAVLAAIGRSLGRSIDPFRLLAVAAVGVCVVDPSAIASPGFQLSFGAVVGLLRFGPSVDALAARLPRGLGWLGRGTSATVGATLGTLPAAAWWFQSLSWTSPIANLIAIPWMSVAVVPLAAGASFAPEPLAGACGWLGGHSVDALLAVLTLLRAQPLAPAVGPAGALFLALILVVPRWDATAAVLLIGLGLRTRAAGGLEVTFFDVGQGDAALVEHPDGRRWLIDGGRGDGVLRALRRAGVRRLDAVFASHADADHAAGLLPVVEQLSVGALWLARPDGHDALIAAARARGVPVVFRPGLPGASDNDASLVVRVDSPWGSVLFAGDLEAIGERAWGAHATVLKVPHHGARTSSTAAFLDAVRPALGVVSVGPNRYGHPHPTVEARYRERGIPLLRTDLDGTITVRFDREGVRAQGATGPLIWLDGARGASTPNTTTANSASTTLNPWL